MKRFLFCFGVAAAVLTARPASAATIVFDICDVASLCGHLSMTTTLNAGTIDVQVSSDGNYGLFGSTGNNRALGFNVVGSEVGLSVFNITPGFTFGGTDQQINGYGFFEYFINGPQRGSDAFLPLSFSVSRTGGFFSDLDLFETNAAGYVVAAHLRNNSSGVTGFVAADGVPTTPSVVPEPATMLLLGTGLLAAARARRKTR